MGRTDRAQKMKIKDNLKRSFFFKGFFKKLAEKYGEATARAIWDGANARYAELKEIHFDMDSDSKMMILPASALYEQMQLLSPKEECLNLLKDHCKEIGEKLARMIHAVTSIPLVSKLLWLNMPKLMRMTSSPKKGYTRRIVSETKELVGVDILTCPIHDAAMRVGIPEISTIVCAMDKAYMSGFKYIQYTRTSAVAEGGQCCDYRLSFDKNKR